ncbi:MAG: peptidoglycan editing factor PgeF [Alphaproteobacteria bacterium]|nr:peptidoglycan editing factor PgeF [Alphaproteobacteria bacterium]
MITTSQLNLPGIAHGFFTREGGFSSGIFSSLNCGLGSGDDIALVTKNRAKVADDLGVAHSHLVSGYQVHGADVAVVTGPLAERPKVDGLVSRTPGVAIGILTADCGPVLFADPQAHVIGACHAGWKGALYDVPGATIATMIAQGAKRANIIAVLGPTISQKAYEVGPDFPKPFLEQSQANTKYFIPSVKYGSYMFDLPAYLIDHLRDQGIGMVHDTALCTYSDTGRFFSYRRTTHKGEQDYGRLISTIALVDV